MDSTRRSFAKNPMSWRTLTLAWGFMLFMLVALPSSAMAHQSSYTYGSLAISDSGREVHYEVRLSSNDLFEALKLGEDRDATDAEIVAGEQDLRTYVFNRVHLVVLGQACAQDPGTVKVVNDGQRFAQVQTTVRCSSAISSVELVYDLFFDLDERHEGLLRVGAGLVQLTNARRRYVHTRGSPAPETRLGFLRSGALHVLYGPDHILFLLSLLVVIGLRLDANGLRARTIRESLRGAAGIVTAFTIGHSMTLVMAALGWISLPNRFVESMIAASIVYVAVENALRPDPPRRALVTLLFGFMHGLGFASMLRPLLPAEDVVLPLLVFNLGVEVGQLAIVAIALPILWGAIAMLGASRYRRIIIPITSVLLAIAGTLWFAERALAL